MPIIYQLSFIFGKHHIIPSLFHAKSITSSKVSDFDPGVIGILILCKSQINISDSDAPDANKFDYNMKSIMLKKLKKKMNHLYKTEWFNIYKIGKFNKI